MAYASRGAAGRAGPPAHAALRSAEARTLCRRQCLVDRLGVGLSRCRGQAEPVPQNIRVDIAVVRPGQPPGQQRAGVGQPPTAALVAHLV
jgi:hypothetical protein